MLSTYTYPKFAYRRPAELDRAGKGDRHPVVVVGMAMNPMPYRAEGEPCAWYIRSIREAA